MNKLDTWFDEGQKPKKVNLGVPPKTSAWDAFIIWGAKTNFMQPTNREREEEAKLFVKEIGLI